MFSCLVSSDERVQITGGGGGQEQKQSRANVFQGAPLGRPLPSNLILHAVIEKLFL